MKTAVADVRALLAKLHEKTDATAKAVENPLPPSALLMLLYYRPYPKAHFPPQRPLLLPRQFPRFTDVIRIFQHL